MGKTSLFKYLVSPQMFFPIIIFQIPGEAKKEYPDIVPSENMREGFQKCAKERFKTTELDSEFKLQTYHIFHDCYKEEVVDIHKSMETGSKTAKFQCNAYIHQPYC